MEETQKLPPPVTVRDVAQILRRRAPIALFTFVLVVASTLFATSLMKPVYEAKTRLILDRPSDNAIPSNVMELLAGRSGNSLSTEIEKIKSRPFLEQVIQQAKTKTDDPEDLEGRLRASSVGEQILEVYVRAETAEEAQKLAQTVGQVYIARARTDHEDKVDISQERLLEARDKAKKEKDAAEVALNAFTSKTGISDPSILFKTRAETTMNVRNGLEAEQKGLSLLEATLRNLNERIRTVPAKIEGGISLIKNPVIDGYRQELYGLEVKRKEMLFDYQPDSIEIQALDRQIKAKQDAIERAQKNLYSIGSKGLSRNPDFGRFQSQIQDTGLGIKQSQARIASMTKQLAELELEQKRLTELQNTWEGLKRRREGANEIYEQARLGLIRMMTSGDVNAPSITVLDKAQLPKRPISPNPVLNVIMALALGLFMGGGIALLAEYMAAGGIHDDGYDPDLPQVGGIPLLGSIPIALPAPAETSGLPALLNTHTGAIDALREIGFTLAHRRPGEPVPVVLLSGTRSDDSSAAVAAQLAATLVRDGLRVTLVDADRSQPRLNRVFGAPDAPGLADVLAGRKSVKEILHVGAGGNLRFLAAGAPDDTTPITEKGFRSLVQSLSAEKDTDIVVVSGPAVWQAPLVAPLEKVSTGMVLVAPDAAQGVPPSESVARARRLLSNGYKPRLLGVIVGYDAQVDSEALLSVPAQERGNS